MASARRAADPRGALRQAAPCILAVLALVWLPAARAGAQAAGARDGAAQGLSDARAEFTRGDPAGALEALRTLRSKYPASPLVPDSLALSVQISLSMGDDYRARYFCQSLLDTYPGSSAAFATGLMVASWFYDRRSWSEALHYYATSVETYRPGVSGQRPPLDVALLRAAELSLYHGNDPDAARGFIARIQPGSLGGPDASLFRELRVRLLWSVIGMRGLGLQDANISSLRVDGDDLWVGTWNGGVSRYAISSARSDPFPGPAFSRSIEVADRRVWVGTAEGLAWYGKGTGTWGSEDVFGGDTPMKVQVIRRAGASLFAGTLGDGLFRLGDTGWTPVSDGALPGRFITTLAEDGARQRLLIGTLALGLVILDLKTGAMSLLSDSVPRFTSANITSILPCSDGRVWIGTYGDGLSAWTPESAGLHKYTKESGEIADDWVLAACETDRAFYFGTFGGGVSVLSKTSSAWKTIGIADGLAALDVTAIEWRAPWLFFGTLGAGVSVYDEAADGAKP